MIALVASTVSAVPRMTVESSFTGMIMMPSSAAARYALNARRFSTGEQSMIAMSKSSAASSRANFSLCSRSRSSFWSTSSITEGMTDRPVSPHG